MQRKSYPLLVIAALVAGCGAADNPDSSRTAAAAATVAPDLEAIAKGIVTHTAEVKEGDVVLITGGVRDLELLENIAVNVRAVGGRPLVALASERIMRRSYDDVPEKYDTMRDTWGEVINSTADVVITVDFTETPGLISHVPVARIAARNKANEGIDDIGVRRGVRVADVGNGLYPTHSRAAQLRISRDDLAKFFWNSLATDFTVIEENAKRVREVLLSARDLHVTTPNGTDLRFRLNPKPNVLVSDGTIPTVEEAGKGVSRAAYLPAGEVFTLIASGSADGKLVADQYPYQGKMIPNLTVNVSAGRITSFTADGDIERLKATYDAATPGRDQLTIIDFGINPGIENTAETSIRSWVPVGTVTLGFGNDIWAGGTNRSTFNLNTFLTNATVTADGREIVKDGKLII